MNEYTSNFEMQNDLALFKGQPYAWKTSGGLYELFLTMGAYGYGSTAAAALKPLAKFGFQFGTSSGGS